MADIELVVKMPEEVYKSIINGKNYISYQEYVEETIKNGTPLPKGHGRIMDVDKVIKKMEEREEQLKDDRSIWETAGVETALDMFGETIIEADKGEEYEPDDWDSLANAERDH